MPPDPDAAATSPSATDPPEASARAPALDYAPGAQRRSVRRWMAAHPAVMALLAVAVAAAIAWYGWKWQLRKDEREFTACTSPWQGNAGFTFYYPPTRGALRHLARLPGTHIIWFYWPAAEAKELTAAFATVKLPNVTEIHVGEDMDADALVKVLARPEAGWRALTTLILWNTKVTDAGLKELARPDCGLKALTGLYLGYAQVTDAGLKELARPDCGLKALASLGLGDTNVTDEGLKELARPDSGLKALTWLGIWKTQVTDAGVAELRKARPGLAVNH